MSIVVGSISATSQTVSGMPARPRFILFTGTNRTEFNTIVTTGARGGFLGFASNDAFESEAITNYCEFVMMAGGSCSSLSANACYAQSSQGAYNSNNLYRGSVTSFNNNGFTISFDVSSASHTVYYMAFCGIDGSASFLYEPNCDGDISVSIGVETSLLVALGQWRNNCHTLPKSTSTERWYDMGIADLAGGSGILGSEWMFQSWNGGDSRLTQRWDTVINQPGTGGIVSAIADPFVFGTTIPLGYLEVSQSGTDITLNEPGQGGMGFAMAALNELCSRMECGRIVAGGVGTTQTFDLTEIATTPEGVFFINMESAPKIQSNEDGRAGCGLASPTVEYSWMCNGADGSFYQSNVWSWISRVNVGAVSGGTTDFTPIADEIGFTTQSNSAGGGVSGFGAIRTYCDAPPLVSFSGFLTTRPSGSQITTRGGHITPGEGTGGRTVP